MTKLWRAIGVPALLGVLSFVAACGDSDNTSPAAPPSPTAVPSATRTTAPPSATLTQPPTASPTPPSPTATATPTGGRAGTPNPIDALPTDATYAAPGLGGGTDVVIDEHGMPHIFAPDSVSALYVQGYLTAHDRFWEMDAFRRVAEGRLSEIFGRLTLSTDVAMRTEFTTRDGRRIQDAMWDLIQQTDPEVASLLTAYAAGVNAWLADLRAGRNGATLPPEYNLGIIIDLTADELDDWRPQDTLAIARLQAWNLSDSMEDEIARAAKVAALPDAVYRDVFRFAPAEPDTVLPVSAPPSPTRRRTAAVLHNALTSLPANLAEIAAGLTALRQENPFGRVAFDLGSNNWIIAPSLSANGHAMLANDPHLQLFNPPIWHMIQLDAGGATPERAIGVIFPGLPSVILGHNDFGAWGATTANYDVIDVYVETVTTPPDYPNSPRTVLFKGQQVPVLRIDEPFTVRKVGTITEVIEVVPHHGPMVPDPNLLISNCVKPSCSARWRAS